jgi:hypothetical protein
MKIYRNKMKDMILIIWKKIEMFFLKSGTNSAS